MNKTLICFLGLLVCASLLSGCRKNDIRTVTIKVPELKNAACARLIQDAFMQQTGIFSMTPDFQERQITIKYNSMEIALKNLEYTIAGAGFAANSIPANTNAWANLPPECK